MTETPRRGQRLRVDGELVVVEMATPSDTGVDLIVRLPDGALLDRSLTWEQLSGTVVPENDGQGLPAGGLAGLWGRWMQYASPRLRSAALATRPLRPFAHQDEAVFDHMLPQPRLRFLLADEPGTGKTIMTGMYVVEARRRGLVPGPCMIVVPAHLVQKWQEELEDFFGIRASRLTQEVARDPKDLDPRVDVWVTSLDLFTHNPDVRRKVAGPRASWSLAVFDEAHRLTPTSRYLAAAQELARATHHLLLLTATPHRGKEHYFRGLCNLLDPTLYPWDPDSSDEGGGRLKPSRLSFLRRMKEELRDLDGDPLFPARYAETVAVSLSELEFAAYEAVMQYAESWYGENSTLALSIYGKRAASCLVAAQTTLRRRLDMLGGAASKRGHGQLPESLAEGLRGDRFLSDGFEDPEEFARAEDVLLGSATKDKQAEIDAVNAVLAQLNRAISSGEPPAKWKAAEQLAGRHGISPGAGQLLVFTEFADTARWLAQSFAGAGYSVETLEGTVDHRDRHRLQQRFLAGQFQILVSTDAGGEGINLQSAHVMIDWDIPWSLVRLEQRMGRLHRIGQKKDVYIYHLVARETREGRVQEVMLGNLEAAAESLGGRIFDLLDATVSRASGDFDFARVLAKAQSSPDTEIAVPDIPALKKAGEALVNADRHLRAKVDQAAAAARFRADRLEAINPVIVDGFVDALALAQGWTISPGPAQGIRRLRCSKSLPAAIGGSTAQYFAADGGALQQARTDGAADLDDVVVLGPTEEAFGSLIELAVEIGRPELLRGCRLVDTGSLTEYTLLIYEAEIRMHDGLRQVGRPAPVLIRWSGAGAFEVSWESLMSLKPGTGPAGNRPTPAQLADGDAEAKAALRREVERQKLERLGWVDKARHQLNDLEDRFLAEIAELPKVERQGRHAKFQVLKDERLAQLAEIEDVQPTVTRMVGWVNVAPGITRDQLGYDPNAEKAAVSKVIAELEALGYSVDDRQTARVGYDLLARHRQNADQRCVEVKGFTSDMGAVWLEQSEWAQALQRGDDYWLYVVEHCGTKPKVSVRVRNPAEKFGSGATTIQRFQIRLSQLQLHADAG